MYQIKGSVHILGASLEGKLVIAEQGPMESFPDRVHSVVGEAVKRVGELDAFLKGHEGELDPEAKAIISGMRLGLMYLGELNKGVSMKDINYGPFVEYEARVRAGIEALKPLVNAIPY